jgi:DNA invertase Pin-like site-specific DNA recombinase
MIKETIIYLRTSTGEQNPENQLKDCISINKYGDYILLQDKQTAFKDDKERDNFNIVLDSIKKNKVKYFIVWDLDRIYRNRIKLLDFFNLCKTHNCIILSYRQNFLNEIETLNLPKGFEFIKEMMINNFLQFLGWIAEDESRKKSDRVKIAVRKKEGVTLSYKGNKWGRKSLSTFKQNKIKELSGKLSIRQIAKELFIRDRKSVV